MATLNWEDASETDATSKSNASSFKDSMATPWFGATVLLVSMIVGFIFGKLF